MRASDEGCGSARMRCTVGWLVALAGALAGCPPQSPPRRTTFVEYTAVSAGSSHTCALTRTGAIYCWGNNSSGELGNGTQAQSSKPKLVVSPGQAPFTRVSAGSAHTCAIAQGTVYCWGLNLNGQVGNDVPPNGQPVLVPTPAKAPSGVTFKEIAAGGNFTCAVATTGEVYCWGQTLAGKLGAGTPTSNLGKGGSTSDPSESVTKPTPILGTDKYKSIAAHGDHACGVTTSNDLWCWGDNLQHQLGAPSTVLCPSGTNQWPCSPRPVRVNTNWRATQVALGWQHGCATDDKYNIRCWGSNQFEQYVRKGSGMKTDCTYSNGGPMFECSDTPFLLPRIGGAGGAGGGVGGAGGGAGTQLGFVQVATGDDWVCSSIYPIGNSVRCWGRNVHGQLGDGTTTSRGDPKPLSPELGALDVSGGAAHTCLVTDGATSPYRVYCWGHNVAGQLGNGTTTNSSTPNLVVEP